MPVALILALSGVAGAADCEPVDPAVAAAAAVALVIDDELDAASREAWGGLNALDCLEDVPRPEDLATLWQVLGAIGIYRGELGLAGQNLARAAAVYPGWFDDRLGQEVQDAWVVASIAAVESAGLSVSELPEGATLYLDGLARPGAPVSLAPGRHVIQVVQDEALIYSLALVLAEDQHAEIATGLAAPVSAQRGRSPWLIGAGAAALAAVGSYAVAWRVDSQLPDQVDVKSLDESYFTARTVGYGVAGGLAGAAVIGVGLHVAIW